MMVTTRNIENFHWTGLVKSCGKDIRRKKRAALRIGIRFDWIFSSPLLSSGSQEERGVRVLKLYEK